MTTTIRDLIITAGTRRWAVDSQLRADQPHLHPVVGNARLESFIKSMSSM